VALSTHVLDISRGKPAAGVAVELARGGTVVASVTTGADGRATVLDALEAGEYELRFAVGDYFGGEPGFLGIVPVRFRVTDPGSHHHVPLLVAPSGYTTYRGS
jgi:5-hydroxyisourate hydrolase